VVAAYASTRPGREPLDRVPAEQIELTAWPGAVIPVEQKKSRAEVLANRFNQPLELFPWLIMALLLALAIEGLFAKGQKFYRAERAGGKLGTSGG